MSWLDYVNGDKKVHYHKDDDMRLVLNKIGDEKDGEDGRIKKADTIDKKLTV